MSQFINTIDKYGEDTVMDMLIEKNIDEFRDDVITSVGAYAFYECVGLTDVDLPNVTTVGDATFQNCSSLIGVNIPNLAGTLNSSAFYDCSKLNSLNIPLCTRIGGSAFRGCKALVELNAPNVERLDANSLRGCSSITSLDFPKLSYIDVYVFCGCSSLKTLILRRESGVASLGTSCFLYNNEKTPIGEGTGFIYVPRALVDSYKAANNWSTYASRIRAIEDYTVDGTVTGELDESKILEV